MLNKAWIFVGATLLVCRSNASLPRPDHVVLVIEENHGYDPILGPYSPATYIQSLAAMGASFTNSFAIDRPSQPNYLDLYSGDDQGTSGTNSYLPNTPLTTPNLGAQFRAAGLSFTGYSQGLPRPGSLVEEAGDYMHKHNPWSNWQADVPIGNQLPPSTNQPFTSFPSTFSQLPTLSIVVPDQANDMHNGSIEQGDAWLYANINRYYEWAQFHNSLLIVTFDEDDFTPENHIPTIFAGPMIKPGQYSQVINHFSVLRTIEDIYGLGHIGAASDATTIADAFYNNSRSWISGDANFDGVVDSGDFQVLASNFNGAGKSWITGDFDGNGVVNAVDFNKLATNYGESSPPAMGSLMPEASSLIFLIAGVHICSSRRVIP